MDSDLFESMKKTTKVLKKGYVCNPIFTPCCMASSTLKGKPAPQYHCNDCDKVYTSLEPFVTKLGVFRCRRNDDG